MLGALITSCSDSRKEQVELACNKIHAAGEIYTMFIREIEGKTFSGYQSVPSTVPSIQTSPLLKNAGIIFRDLSAEDSGFARFASIAFELSQGDIYRDWDYQDWKEIATFCGVVLP